MGLLRASADAVLVGAGTHAQLAQDAVDGRARLPTGRPAVRRAAPLARAVTAAELAVLSGSGSVDPRHPALEEGAVVLTSRRGATRLRGRLPSAATILAIGAEAPVDPVAVVEALRRRGHELILSEGGPIAFGALVAAGLVDELFLTTSPLLAGRSPGSPRPALVEQRRVPPGHDGRMQAAHAQARRITTLPPLRAVETRRGERRHRHRRRRQCLVGGAAIGARLHWHLRGRRWVYQRREVGPPPGSTSAGSRGILEEMMNTPFDSRDRERPSRPRAHIRQGVRPGRLGVGPSDAHTLRGPGPCRRRGAHSHAAVLRASAGVARRLSVLPVALGDGRSRGVGRSGNRPSPA